MEKRSSRTSLSKSKEKLSADGAEEKLLQKEDEAKVTTRVDMADAKYVVGDHRNGDAKIELDANKKQFSGLTKEELLKYAEDPFWIRLRWFMFVLFWALWLCMLAGAIAIILRAPKCSPPPPKTWYQKGPLADLTPQSAAAVLSSADALPYMQADGVQGLFVSQDDAYRVLDDDKALDDIKKLVAKAKEFGVRVIVDLTASYVSSDHSWFQLALNKSEEFGSYFIWADVKDYDDKGKPNPPNNWISTLDKPAWTYSGERNQFYYQLYGDDKPQLNFNNSAVVKRFDDVLNKYMQAGIAGVRLLNARELLANMSLPPEQPRGGPAADHTQRAYWTQRHSADQTQLTPLLQHWAYLVAKGSDEATVFTLKEPAGRRPFCSGPCALRPPLTRALVTSQDGAVTSQALLGALRRDLTETDWPAIMLESGDPSQSAEWWSWSVLLPATPLLPADLYAHHRGNTSAVGSFANLASLRQDASIEHGNWTLTALGNGTEQILVCARWKAGHTGYVSLLNLSPAPAHADLSGLPPLPADVTMHYATDRTRALSNYTSNQSLESSNVLVPANSALVLSYVPNTSTEK